MSLAPKLYQNQKTSLYAMAAIGIASCILAAVYHQIFFVLLPFVLLVAFIAIVNYELIFYGFFFLLPFSIEVELPGGLGTDLPSEPIMWFLLLLYVLLFVWKGKEIDTNKMFNNPISKIMLLHLLWIGITAMMSTHLLISVKFFVAKLWYVFPFYFLSILILKEEASIEKVVKYLLAGTTIAVTYVMFNHGLASFTFSEINFAVRPIFRNHVNYAGLLVLIAPFIWANARIRKSKISWILLFYILVAVYLTYTRAAYGVVILSVVMYFVIRWRLMKWLTPVALLVVGLFVNNMVQDSHYLEFAPNYERTVTHTKFNNLIEATYQLEDISTMERLYRWVAGFHMLSDKPFFGHGPATFFTNYKTYTVSSFQTYVSDNPEKSGIHNYYLMTAVEQGFIGLILLLLLILVPLFMAEGAYRRNIDNSRKHWIMAAALSYFATAVLITINDLLEADKVGPIFFLSASIIVIMNYKKTRVQNKAS